MPYVLQHSATKQIYTCMLVNHYQLAYYGVKYWAEAREAEEEARPFLQAAGVAEPAEWDVREMDEREMKLCNVRLKNDPAYVLFENEAGKPEARKGDIS